MPKRHYRKLPQSVMTEIRRLYSEIGNGYEVAKMLGISKSAVYRYLETKRKYKKWNEGEIEHLTKLRALGKNRRQIAKIMGCSPTAVSIALMRHRRKMLADENRRKVIKGLMLCANNGLSAGKAIQAVRRARMI